MFLRLWTRAPCTAIVRRAVLVCAFPLAIMPPVDERQLLDFDVALLRQSNGDRCLADDALVGQILAGGRHVTDIVIALEIVVDLPARAGFAGLLEVLENRREEDLCAIRNVAKIG